MSGVRTCAYVCKRKESVCVSDFFYVCSVQYDGHRVVSGAYDYLVKMWDPVEGTCLYTLTGHTNRVYSLQVR